MDEPTLAGFNDCDWDYVFFDGRFDHQSALVFAGGAKGKGEINGHILIINYSLFCSINAGLKSHQFL
jgi:hypothetical protein